MSSTKIEYYEIAQIQIDTAIELYFLKNYICAITLAGAAEELLGKLLIHQSGGQSALKNLTLKLQCQFPNLTSKEINDNYLNFIRNRLKHFNEDICEQDINIKTDSIQLICRAAANYCKLTKAITPRIQEFNSHLSETLTD